MDVSKVMEGLNFCSDGHNCKFCPYYNSGSTRCVSKLAGDAYRLLAEKSNEPRNTLNKLLGKLECHSNYHGDTIVAAIRVLKEGKELPEGRFKPLPLETETEYLPKVFKDEDFEEPSYYCGKCGVEVMVDYDNYCSSCGAKIKWAEDQDLPKDKSKNKTNNPSRDNEYHTTEPHYSKNFYDFCNKDMKDLYFDIQKGCVNKCCDSIVKEISSFLEWFRSSSETPSDSTNNAQCFSKYDVMNLNPGSDIWIESRSIDGLFQIVASTICYVDKHELICVSSSRRYMFDDYNYKQGYWCWRAWSSRPDETTRSNTHWNNVED